jgi:hypothetical protein
VLAEQWRTRALLAAVFAFFAINPVALAKHEPDGP